MKKNNLNYDDRPVAHYFGKGQGVVVSETTHKEFGARLYDYHKTKSAKKERLFEGIEDFLPILSKYIEEVTSYTIIIAMTALEDETTVLSPEVEKSLVGVINSNLRRLERDTNFVMDYLDNSDDEEIFEVEGE